MFGSNLHHKSNTYLITLLCPCLPKLFSKSTAFDTNATKYPPHPCSCSNYTSTSLSPVGFSQWIGTMSMPPSTYPMCKGNCQSEGEGSFNQLAGDLKCQYIRRTTYSEGIPSRGSEEKG
jgi:hypothetical protein